MTHPTTSDDGHALRILMLGRSVGRFCIAPAALLLLLLLELPFVAVGSSLLGALGCAGIVPVLVQRVRPWAYVVAGKC